MSIVPNPPVERSFLTKDELMAMAPRPGEPTAEFWDHAPEHDTIDDLRPVEW